MFDSDSKLKHLPFFEELAALDENSDAWNSATAGLVTLRLVDSWLESGTGDAADDEWNFKSVCAAIESMSDRTPMRSLLTGVLTAVQTGKPNIRAVVPTLMAYAKALEFDAKWVLASDVYQTLLSHLHPLEDGESCIAAHLQLGSCYRNLSRIDLAFEAFRSASEIGNVTGDMVGILRGRLGEAQIAWARGNLPGAEALLDETIARATDANLSDVRSRALADRAGVAIIRGQYEFGIQIAYEAFGTMQNPVERDKILNNIAGAFANLGVYTAARDAYLVLSATASEQYLRWAATLNLLEVASMMGHEPLFESYRRQLAGADMPPLLATGYALTLGQGYHRLGKPELAQAHLERAIEMASAYGLSQSLFDAEASLEAVRRESPKRNKVELVPLDLEEIAGALRGLREAAVG